MIKANFNRNDDGDIVVFEVEGHAGYAPSGRDIVCAAVSALVIGTVNGLEVLSDASFETSLSYGVTKVFVEEPTSSSNILLRSLIMSLEGIQEEYPEHIKIAGV